MSKLQTACCTLAVERLLVFALGGDDVTGLAWLVFIRDSSAVTLVSKAAIRDSNAALVVWLAPTGTRSWWINRAVMTKMTTLKIVTKNHFEAFRIFRFPFLLSFWSN